MVLSIIKIAYIVIFRYNNYPFDDEDYIYELKLDGIRCVAYIEPKSVVLQNKRHKDVTAIYPELQDIKKCVK